MPIERKLAAIMFTDIAGYTEQMSKDERWRKYPKQNWKDECPKSPNNLIGKDTRFKSHPKELDRINDNQSKELG